MKIIEQWKVTRFCKRAAAMTRAKKKQDKLKEEILKELQLGYIIPNSGPYVIELCPNGGKEPIDWEHLYTEMYTAACVKKFGVPAGLKAAEEKIMAIKASAKPKESVEVAGMEYVGGVKFLPKVNPDYRASKSSAAA